MTKPMTKDGEEPVKSSHTRKTRGYTSKRANAEAMEANKAKVKEAENKIVWFESRLPEDRQFDVAGFRSVRDFDSGKIMWKVPAKEVERFKKHHFYVSGRIVPKAV